MRVTVVDVAILQWAIRLLSWFTAIIEMGIVVSGSNLGPYRGSWAPAMTTPILGLFILAFLRYMWGEKDEFRGNEPVLLVVRTPVEDDISVECWLPRFRRGMLKRGFLREQRLPVPRGYLISYTVILVLDTIVFLLWITDVTIDFPWNKKKIEAELFAAFPIDLVQSWSSVWLPHLIFELINCVLFTMVYIAGWIIVVWLFILRWKTARIGNAGVQPPAGRRAVILQELGEQPQKVENSPQLIPHIKRSGKTQLALIPGGQGVNINEEEEGIRGGITASELGEQPQKIDNSPKIIPHIERSGKTQLALIPGGQGVDINEEEKGIRGGSTAPELGGRTTSWIELQEFRGQKEMGQDMGQVTHD